MEMKDEFCDLHYPFLNLCGERVRMKDEFCDGWEKSDIDWWETAKVEKEKKKEGVRDWKRNG
jgi:hypothetical protein